MTTRRALIGISSPVFGLRPGRWFLLAQVEVAEAGELDLLARSERTAQFLEEQVDELTGLPLVEAELVEQRFCNFRLGQCHLIYLVSWLCAPAPGH